MVCPYQIIVHRLGNTDKTDIAPCGCSVPGKLADGIHGIIAAYIKEVSDVHLFQLLKNHGIEPGRQILRKFIAAGAQISRRSQLQNLQLFIRQLLRQVHIPVLHKPFDSI